MADLTELALRNQVLAARQHARTRRQQLRGTLLTALARLPLPPIRGDGRTILLIRPDHLGDVLLTTPAIRALAAALPEARLVALVGLWSAGVISAYPEIDLTLTLPFPGFARHPARASAQPYLLAWRWANHLRRLQVDSAIVFRPDHWWGAMLAFLARIPRRIGFALPDVAPFLTDAVPFRASHAVERGLALIRALGVSVDHPSILTFPIQDEDREFVHRQLAEAGLPPTAPRVIIHPGTGTRIKQWPSAHWALVADHLARRWGAPILFTGSDHEISLVRSITDQMAAPAIVLAGETTVGQLAALYEGARVVLGPDSGPLHLATAVGAPTVHLYGPADPAEFGPWGDPVRHIVLTTAIACRPCRILDWPGADPADHPCVRDIAPEAVLEAAIRATGES
ncbi:MAG: glycosyltransferase family 9 protein [Anaerolineae bacterium]|nr:glycosyltransferase family 9 protein [Anaerolineae bacterium]